MASDSVVETQKYNQSSMRVCYYVCAIVWTNVGDLSLLALIFDRSSSEIMEKRPHIICIVYKIHKRVDSARVITQTQRRWHLLLLQRGMTPGCQGKPRTLVDSRSSAKKRQIRCYRNALESENAGRVDRTRNEHAIYVVRERGEKIREKRAGREKATLIDTH